jgi:hypothetical protein
MQSEEKTTIVIGEIFDIRKVVIKCNGPKFSVSVAFPRELLEDEMIDEINIYGYIVKFGYKKEN